MVPDRQAGALFALLPILPWLLSAVAQVGKGAASALLSQALDPGAPEADPPGRLQWLTAGLRVLLRVRLLGGLAVVAGVLNFAGSGVVLAVILGLRVDGQSPQVVGLTGTAMGAGPCSVRSSPDSVSRGSPRADC